MQQGLFRPAALERLSSPDQLDQLLQVTSPKGWLALASLTVLIVGAVVWSIVGSLATTVRAQGVLIKKGGAHVIASHAAGEITEVKVERGDVIARGQVVATVEPYATNVSRDVINPFPEPMRVLEIREDEGNPVSTGTAVINVEPINRPTLALIYLPATSAEQVHQGMPVQISPVSVKREKYGFIRGKVRSVAQFPSTRQGMQALLANESLVQHLLAASGGTPVEVEAELFTANTPSGVQWSSSAGPPQVVSSGTLLQAEITVGEERPINLVLPYIRRALFVSR
ncbi:MAG: HlyD family efflux transporter periplasmic adaptor subunit [Armatimonadetes bacterium]|nr:HlyD family efflux transporter periplasmic adaptor subunit [Armatimonadota bacterium]